jgi:hypothetical protein
MQEVKNSYKILVENLKERDHLGGPDVDSVDSTKMNLQEIQCKGAGLKCFRIGFTDRLFLTQ